MELPFSADVLHQSQMFYALMDFLPEDRPSCPESPDRMAMPDAIWAITKARGFVAAGLCDMETLWRYEACVGIWARWQNGDQVLMDM